MPLSLETSKKLKQAGLNWDPKTHDYFAVPDVDMDDKFFALSDMTVTMEVLHGYHAITFNGSVEWALDFVFQTDAIWLPTETQLRELIISKLGKDGSLMLQSSIGGYVATVQNGGSKSIFEGITAEEAYASALQSLL